MAIGIQGDLSVSEYHRTVEELYDVASMFWPEEISRQAAALSVIPTLLQTQEQFVTILGVDIQDIKGLFQVIRSSKLSPNLFLKHLVILADYGGEPLKQLNSIFTTVFPEGNISRSQI